MDLKEIKKILREYNLRPDKRKGQNFLWKQDKIARILESADLEKNDNVVEIGPGLGVLTERLVQNVKNVETVEIDSRLVAVLKKRFKDAKNLEIINKDALQFAPAYKNYKIVANIPYYITSPLLRHFLMEAPIRPKLIVFLVQKEVAEKICSKKKLSILSLQVKIFGEPEIIDIIDRGFFYPEPRVDSAILKVIVFDKPLVKNPEKFLETVKFGFSAKRKKLINALFFGLRKEKKEIISLLKKAEIDGNRRAETLTITEWERLGNHIM